jgi:multicomponent Na+:H+ antiporter subunit C
MSNPLPQALALTAIVISFGLTLFLLALAVRQQDLTGDDLVEDDLEDRRIRDETSDEELLAATVHGDDDVPDGTDPGRQRSVA